MFRAGSAMRIASDRETKKGQRIIGDLARNTACRTAQSDHANMLIRGRFLKGSGAGKSAAKRLKKALRKRRKNQRFAGSKMPSIPAPAVGIPGHRGKGQWPRGGLRAPGSFEFDILARWLGIKCRPSPSAEGSYSGMG